MTINRVRIEDEKAAEAMGKPVGYYITLEVPRLKERDPKLVEEVSKNLAEELQQIFDLPPEATYWSSG